MTEKIFDDYVRDKLRNHSSPIPDGLWEKIAKEKDRRPVGFFWNNRLMTGLFLLAVVAIGGFMLWQTNSNTKQVTATKETASTNQIQTINKTGTSTPSSNNNSTTENNNNTTAGNSPTNAIEKTATAATNKATDNKNVSVSESKVEKMASAKNTGIPVDRSKKIVSAEEEQQGNENSKQWMATNNRASSKKAKYGTIPNADNSIQTLSTINRHEQSLTEQLMLAPKSLGHGELMSIENKKALGTFNKLPNNFQQLKLSGITDCPSANGYARNDLYLELYASPDYTFKSVMGGAASSAYLQKKDSTETMRVGYTVGGRITKNIGEHLIVKAGLQFSQINERFTLRTENERRTTTVITTRNITDAAGNVTTVSDTTSFTQIGYLVKTSNNYYRSIELPLMLGYEFGNDKLKFSLNGGAIVNIAAWYKGNTLDTSYQSIAIAKSGNDVYKHSVAVSLYGSLSIIKPVAEKFDLFAEPYFRYSLSNMNSNTLGYNQRFSTMGLSLGIRYKLNGKKQRL